MRQTGMEIAKSYYSSYGESMLYNQFPEYEHYAAVGLVGEGSECFGFDDEISEDHDFGAGFCVWLPENIYNSVGHHMQVAYDNLPKEFEGKRRLITAEAQGRVGINSISNFYTRYTGTEDGPRTNVEWMAVPESFLATATNGKVFRDPLGEFSKIREHLLSFYPKDVFLKKIVARMAVMSQAGQYNYERCMKRGEREAAFIALSEFVRASVSMVYLLNRRYTPFYKWMFKGMEGLSILSELKGKLARIAELPNYSENIKEKVDTIEEVCVAVRKELNRQNIVAGTDDFLNNHCIQVMGQISDPQIRNLSIMYDSKW